MPNNISSISGITSKSLTLNGQACQGGRLSMTMMQDRTPSWSVRFPGTDTVGSLFARTTPTPPTPPRTGPSLDFSKESNSMYVNIFGLP